MSKTNLPGRATAPAAAPTLRTRLTALGALPLLLAALLAGCGGGSGTSQGQATAQAVDAVDGTKRIAAASPAVAGGVMINEVNAGNWKGTTDSDGDAEDWVELYNPDTVAVDLTGYGLSNKTATPFLWTFPAGTRVAARGYLTVWLSKKDRAIPGRTLHSNFDLDSGGDTVFLTASNATAAGILVDSAKPPLVKSDQSWCRIPSGVASSPFVICDQPTFNAANAGTSYAAIVAKPTLSPKSGFYAAAQTVTLTGPAGATLRYTTDGSEPTAASTAYTVPLLVGASQVIRVAAFAAGSAPSLVETGSYVISASEAGKYAALKAIMVSLSPADLAQFQANNQDVFFRANFELITGATTTVFKMDAEGKAGGNAGSADSPVRVMNVTARDTFGAKSFPGVLWADKPGIKTSKKFRLRNGSNDWNEAHLRDQLAQRVSADGPNVIASSTAVAMFINGRYYGLMDLREREDETLLANNLGIDKDYVDYIQETTTVLDIKNGGAAAQASYTAMVNYITGNDMAVAANYAQAKTLMNPESLAYDWALHMFQANYDWPYHNVDLWRSPEIDSRWTWRPHDMDWSFGIYNTPASYNMNSSIGQPGSAYMVALLRNSEFRNLYLNMVADQMNVMTPAYQRTTLDTMAAELRPYIPDNHAALGLGTVANWEARLVYIRNWMDAREPFYDGHNRTQFNLAARQVINVAVNDVAMGSVQVNLVNTGKYVTAALPTWTGRYYPGVPLTLEAKPKPGFVFVGWQGASTATDRRITQTLVADAAQAVQLTAVFAATAAPAAPVVSAINAQAFRTGDFARVAVAASDPQGYVLTYSATTLPKGLSINAASGVIYGRVTTPGSYASVISVKSGSATSTLAVSWVITDRPGTGLLGTSPNSGPQLNAPPTVGLTAPLANAVFTQGAPITVSATAADSDGTVIRVEFFDGATPIGTATAAPYQITWANAPTGTRNLSAKAFDNTGASSISASVVILVNVTSSAPPPANAVACATEGQLCTLPAGSTASVWFGATGGWALRTGVTGSVSCSNTVFGDPLIGVAKTCVYVLTVLPPGNVAPTVALTAPTANASFVQGVAITVSANAADTDGTVSRVEFYDGATPIGTATASPYSINWSGASLGAHTLTAKAFDNAGASATSASVAINVTAAPPLPGTGTGLLGQYFNNLAADGAAVLTRTEAVNFDWGNGSPGAGVPADFFAARWTGQIEAPSTGAYQFQTNSDDSIRVTINGQVLINNFTPHGPTVDTSGSISLVAGQKYNILVEYQEYSGGALVQLRWKGPSDAAFVAVPANRLYTAAPPPGGGSGSGLVGQYFANLNLSGPAVLTRTEAVNFDWGTGSPGPGVPADFFSVRWSGQVEAPTTGSYQFQATSDDGVRLTVNGQVLLDNFTPHGPTLDTSVVVNLAAGQRYSIVVEYQEYSGGAVMQLRWKGPGEVSYSAIPASRLYAAGPTGGSGTGLRGQYYSSFDLTGAVVLARTEAVDFDWGAASPGAGVPADYFSVRWTGYVEAGSSGSHQFQTLSDDGVRVYVNGQLIINNFTPHGPTVDTSAAVALTAGQRYAIVVEYQEYTGGAVVQLRWKEPSALSFGPVPASRLYLVP